MCYSRLMFFIFIFILILLIFFFSAFFFGFILAKAFVISEREEFSCVCRSCSGGLLSFFFGFAALKGSGD